MKILGLETSAKACSAAVTEAGTVLASAFQCTGLTHSRALMPMVEDMLRNAELTMEDIGAVAVAAGPGSFTGIRIGIAAAKGLAWARELPCAGVSTLSAMARGLAHTDALIVCAMDARRSQVYNALFQSRNGDLIRLTPDRALSLEELAAELRERHRGQEKLVVAGDGGKLCGAYFAEHAIPYTLAPPHLLQQNAMGVALEAESLAAAGRLVTAQELMPVYLRPAQAERLRNERTKK